MTSLMQKTIITISETTKNSKFEYMQIDKLEFECVRKLILDHLNYSIFDLNPAAVSTIIAFQQFPNT